MVKAYLRYDLASTFGVVTSNSNVVYDHTGKLVITASLESVSVWNVKQGTLVSKLFDFINKPLTSRSGSIRASSGSSCELCVDADQDLANSNSFRKNTC